MLTFCWLSKTYKHLPKYSQPLIWWSTLKDMFTERLFGSLTHTYLERQTDMLTTLAAFAIVDGNYYKMLTYNITRFNCTCKPNQVHCSWLSIITYKQLSTNTCTKDTGSMYSRHGSMVCLSRPTTKCRQDGNHLDRAEGQPEQAEVTAIGDEIVIPADIVRNLGVF